VNRRALLALGLLFLALRLLLVLSSADRIHAPDWAEAKHSFLGDRWIQEGPPSLSEVLAAARDSRNSAHGGFLPLSALYASLSVPFGVSDNQLALKLSAIAFATLGFFAWVGVACRIGGVLAGWLAALLLLFPPPIYLAGSMVTWGSHSEATALLGLAALLLLRDRRPGSWGTIVPALFLGCVAAMSSLLIPISGLLLLVWLRQRGSSQHPGGAGHKGELVLALLACSLPVTISWLITGAPGSSVTEEAGNSPLHLVMATAEGLALIPGTLAELLPLPAFGPEFFGTQLSDAKRDLIDWGLLALLLCALAQVIFGSKTEERPVPTSSPDRALSIALLVGAPVLHLLVLLLIGPRRPSVELRYLLPLFPIVLVSLAAAASWAWTRQRSGKTRLWAGVLLCAVLSWLVPGITVQASLLEPSRMGSPTGEGSGFFAWHSPRYIDFDIGNVRYESALGVNDFLSQRGDSPQGFALVPRLTAGQDLLRAFDPPVIDAARLLDRIRRDQSTQPSQGPQRERIYENIGWALAVFTRDRPGLWMSLLSHLGPDRPACAAGLGMGLSRISDTSCEQIHGLQEQDRRPAWEGAAGLSSSFAQRCSPPSSGEGKGKKSPEHP
jgi:hypothetical protein